MDSLDPEGEHGGWSYQDLESPPREDPRYPRLQIENRCYRSREFRKLHLEVAHRQDGLEASLQQSPSSQHWFKILQRCDSNASPSNDSASLMLSRSAGGHNLQPLAVLPERRDFNDASV